MKNIFHQSKSPIVIKSKEASLSSFRLSDFGLSTAIDRREIA